RKRQGGVRTGRSRVDAPSPPLQPKSDISDFGQLITWPTSGKPEVGCKRGREQTELAARAELNSTGYAARAPWPRPGRGATLPAHFWMMRNCPMSLVTLQMAKLNGSLRIMYS